MTISTMEAALLFLPPALCIVGAMAFISHEQQVQYTKSMIEIARVVHHAPFALSCNSDGTISRIHDPNCLEMADYRFGRIGLGTIIVRIDGDRLPLPIYNDGNGGFSYDRVGLHEAARQLSSQAAEIDAPTAEGTTGWRWNGVATERMVP